MNKQIKRKCLICGKEFYTNSIPRRQSKVLGKNRVTCSRKCAKIYGEIRNEQRRNKKFREKEKERE